MYNWYYWRLLLFCQNESPSGLAILPVHIENYQNTVLESLPVHSVVARVKAADADVGPNAEMDYRLMDGDYLGLFNISTDEETQEGVIVLLKVTKQTHPALYSPHSPRNNRNNPEPQPLIQLQTLHPIEGTGVRQSNAPRATGLIQPE